VILCFCVKLYMCLCVLSCVGASDVGRIDVVLPDDLEKKLREAVFQRKGLKRGNIKEAMSEAVILWINEGEKR